jgi:SNF2 family DNA or RNA helicase
VDFGLTFDGVEVPDDRAAAQLVVQEAIEAKGLFVRHLKADVLPNLPSKSFNRIVVPLRTEQQRLYIAALKGLVLDLRSSDEGTFHRQLRSFLAKRNALLQVCSNPISLAEQYNEIPAKLYALDGLLEQLIAKQGEKVVVWSYYTASLKAIFDRFTLYNPVRYDGSVTDVHERREAVRKFQEDGSTMLFVANPAAAGAGLTLHSARFAIYESMSNQAAHYLQSLDRIHRRGQSRSVEYFVLLCDRTIDVVEYERLMSKERSAQELLGDPVAQVLTRDSMLEEAIAMLRLVEEG